MQDSGQEILETNKQPLKAETVKDYPAEAKAANLPEAYNFAPSEQELKSKIDKGKDIEDTRKNLELAMKLEKAAAEMIKENNINGLYIDRLQYDKVMREAEEDFRKVSAYGNDQANKATDLSGKINNGSATAQGEISNKRGILRRFFGGPGKPFRPAVAGIALSLIQACTPWNEAHAEFTEDLVNVGVGLMQDAINTGVSDMQGRANIEMEGENSRRQDEIYAASERRLHDLNYRRDLRQLALDHNYELERAKLEGRSFDESESKRRKAELDLQYGYQVEVNKLDQQARSDYRRADVESRRKQQEVDTQNQGSQVVGNAVGRTIQAIGDAVSRGVSER